MTRNKLEAARDEIERLERLVGDLQNSAEHTVVRDRVREEEMSALEEKVDKWEQRNRVLVARHLRLQEDHEVLIEQSKKNAVSPADMQNILPLADMIRLSHLPLCYSMVMVEWYVPWTRHNLTQV